MLKKLIYMQSRTKVIRDLKFLRPRGWDFRIYFTYQATMHHYQSHITGLPGMILMNHLKFMSSLRLFKDKPSKISHLFNNPTLIPTVDKMEKLPHCTKVCMLHLQNTMNFITRLILPNGWLLILLDTEAKCVRIPGYKFLCL